MSSIVPPTLMFRFESNIRRMDSLPRKGAALLNLPKECALDDFAALNGTRQFAEVRAAWNPQGLGFSFHIRGKKMPVTCDLDADEESDGVQVWLDTRNTQTVHRATRYCHRYLLLPLGGPSPKQPSVVLQKPIARAREDFPFADEETLLVRSEILKDGYRIEFWLPGDALYGFDPEASPTLGFYYHVRDSELGEQFTTVGNDFPFSHDPSLWTTLKLKS